MERVKGIEPSYAAWEAAVLPLNYTRDTVVPIITCAVSAVDGSVNAQAIALARKSG